MKTNKTTVAELLKEIQHLESEIRNLKVKVERLKIDDDGGHTTDVGGEDNKTTNLTNLHEFSVPLQRAIEAKMMIENPDGTLTWNGGSKTLLAYFCGRLWCGDTLERDKVTRELYWKLGKKPFPKKKIEALFGTKGLRELRKQRDMMAPPQGFHCVEKCFR